MAKTAPATKPPTKSEIYSTISEKTGLTRKQVASVFDELNNVIKAGLSKKGPGVFALPGLAKIKVVAKPATKETTKPNPFKPGETMVVKAKPASRKVTIRPLKSLKDLVK